LVGGKLKKPPKKGDAELAEAFRSRRRLHQELLHHARCFDKLSITFLYFTGNLLNVT
jgi:hypothetical protein